MADARDATESLRRSRRAALVAAAALIGPSAPPGYTDRYPDEAATAAVRVAEMFLPWLESGRPLPEPERIRKHREAREAATASRPVHPGTGDDDGPYTEAEHAAARAQEAAGD